MSTRRIKIISDGTGMGTSVVDAVTGEDLSIPITSITWRIDCNTQIATAVIEAEIVAAEVVGEALVPEVVNVTDH